MQANLLCITPGCWTTYPLTDILYQCPKCAGLLEVEYDWQEAEPASWKKLWRERRTSNAPIDQSGVWRYREMLPFPNADTSQIVTLREGNTPLLNAPAAAEYAGLQQLTFKHQGFNPTGSFKDNGMTCGVSQAIRLGKQMVACVSTGNTSASMAAYAAAAGVRPVIFLPHGNISFGKLAQAIEYGALTLQIERANFDEILALVRQIADRANLYLLNSINPFRIEGQKTMALEMLDQTDWKAPDWVVMPGGNLGNTAAFGKGFFELHRLGFIDRLPRIAVIQAAGSAPFFRFMQQPPAAIFQAIRTPETLATAIRIGDPVSWPKAATVIQKTNGVVECASEQEIADAKAIIGRCGIGCEPASAATLAGIKKLVEAGTIGRNAQVVAVLTGNVLKDPDYIYRYHTGELKAPDGTFILPTYGNTPRRVESDGEAIIRLLRNL